MFFSENVVRLDHSAWNMMLYDSADDENMSISILDITHLGFRHIITHWRFRHHPFAHGHKLSLGREAESLHIMTEISSSWNRSLTGLGATVR